MSTVSAFFEKNSWFSLGTALVVIAVMSYVIYDELAGGYGGPDSIYFYNPSTDELVSLPRETLSPATLDDGTKVYEAYAYTCETDPSKDPTILYLIKFSDDAYALQDKYRGKQIPLSEAGPLMAANARLVATVDMAREGDWWPEKSVNGQALTNQTMLNCESGCKRTYALP